MSQLVLDLATDPAVAERLTPRLPAPSQRLRLAELRRLGPWRSWRRLRGTRFERCVVIVNDLRAQRRWLSVLALALVARCRSREIWGPGGQARSVSWSSLLTHELPFLVARTWTSLTVRRRVRRQVRRLRRAGAPRAMRPSRVAFLRADLIPVLEAGGSVAHIHGVIDGFERAGCRVTFVTPGRVRGLEPDAARVQLVAPDPGRRLLPELPYLAYNLDAAARTTEIVRAAGADLVYHRHALGAYLAAAVAQRSGLPLVVEFNGSEAWIARNWGDGLPHRGLFEDIERRTLQAADLVVAVSEPLRQQLRAAGVPDERILINPNGVDAARFDPLRLAPQRERVRRELAVADEEVLVGFVGTFGPWHGAELLARAAAGVPAGETRRLRYLYVGDGERRAATERLLAEAGIADRAHFTGLVPQEETPALLTACDICASPHVSNPDGTPFFGSPTKLFEYLASGRAVLASDLGQIGEVLAHGENAWLVPPGDAGALAEGLARLASDPALRARLGASGRHAAETLHSWDAHVQRILDRLGRPHPA